MRQIRIVSPKIMDGVILFDGSRRREFKSMEELSDKVLDSLQGYSPKKPIEVYLKGFKDEETIRKYLSKKLPRAKYFIN